ncbi:MAG: hypothetical protein Unbinned2716contig1004_5 [Prokaryotic dsDNA virus sp.]|nr:MAG: hypothetical protein Unbinned2716contig1004_5 [Prokaryotic dsDNA virus sp.]|tara:strand:- start:22784 stop:23935 length:1152 start_codon:yes stop_codon:yes gene_type:complete
MARRKIGKPRFYADLPSYLKVKGYFTGTNIDNVVDLTLNPTEENSEKLWQFDPSLTKTFKLDASESSASFDFHFDKKDNLDVFNKQLHELITNPATYSNKTGLYGGVLGHTFCSKEAQDEFQNLLTYHIAILGNPTNDVQDQQTEDAIAFADEISNIQNFTTQTPTYNGYSLWNINGIRLSSFDEGTQATGIALKVYTATNATFDTDTSIDIGAITYGRWFEPEHAFELKASVKNDYEGFKTKNTIGGNTLINIDHLGVPNWGNLPAWTLEKQIGHDYNIGGHTGRRTWSVGLNFMSDDELLSDPNNSNQFFIYDEDANSYKFDDSMSSFFGLTMGGRIPFLFCPDTDADNKEFAKCIITKPPTYKQVANNLFSTNFTIAEVF